MKLPIPNFKKKIIPSYFLVLVLGDEKVKAVIFEEIEGKVKILGQQEEYFSQSIEETDTKEFLEVIDKAISQAESSLPENVQTQKTIFGVKDSWSENNQIKKEYLIKLKKTCEELDLTPIGFLVISQAVSHLLQKEEGSPISGVLVEVNKKSVNVSLIRNGKVIEAKDSEIHESIPFTVDTLLKHFRTSEVLPSRIILFNDKEDLSQDFISHSWSKSIPFLHLPQITNLSDDFDAKSVLFGAATQMGFEVLEKDLPIHEKIAQPKIPSQDDNLQEPKEVNNQALDTYKEIANISSDDFGFVKNKDIAQMKTETEENQDLESNIKEVREENNYQDSSNTESLPEEEKFKSKKYTFLSLLKVKLGKTLRIARKANIGKSLSFLSFLPKGRISIVAAIILFLAIAAFGYYFLLLNATVTLSIKPEITEKNQNIIFSTTSPSDPKKSIIKGEFVKISEEGQVSTPTTGKKEVGTNAKGSVTIFNSLSQSKTLPKGTTVKSPNGLEFTLDQSLTVKGVASHSADETVAPEKATVNITASKIGKEYNLPSGTKFTVESFSITDLVAKNDNPLEGGTKKEVAIVSKNDSDKLETELIKQLEQRAQEDLSKNVDSDTTILPSFISTVIKDKTLDIKIGNEAENVILKGTVEYQAISYKKSDLIAFSKTVMEASLANDQKIDYNNIKASINDIKDKSDKEINSNLNIKALLLPKIDEEKLKKDIKGISFTKAEDLIFEIPQVTNIDISFSPQIPFLPKKLPVREGNIKILINVAN